MACDALVGAPLVPPADRVPNVADLQAEMTRLHISAALVRHHACLQTSAHLGNDVLMHEIAGHPNLTPAWFVIPDGREPQFNPALTLQHMLAAGRPVPPVRAAPLTVGRSSSTAVFWGGELESGA
ncbi:MAG: hypothetical protein ABFE07_15570 [Armatimonadia bacterium]